MRPERLVLALVALGALVLAGTSDFVIGGFWSGHPMLTAILSALVVVLLSAAVIDVILRRRDENRWRVLAQSALIQLAESAHTSWSNLAEDLGLGAMTDPRGRRGQPRREYRTGGGEQDDEWFLNNLLATLNVAVSLEDETWQLALRVLPEAWWDERTLRLAAAAHPPERRR